MRDFPNRHVHSQQPQKYLWDQVSILDFQRLAMKMHFYQEAQEVVVVVENELACRISLKCAATKESQRNSSFLISIWLSLLQAQFQS